MRFLKSFSNFINEGAWIDPNNPNIVLISNTNDSENNDEVLKTTSSESGKDLDLSIFTVYWGLTYKEYIGKIDHEGRFKYTMDALKAAERTEDDESHPMIYDKDGDSGEAALSKFIEYNFLKLNIFSPDYICSIGSTEGLAGMLGRSINSVYSDAALTILNKVVYLNAADAFDFVEFKSQVEQQFEKDPTSKTFASTKKHLINTYIDKKLTNALVLSEIEKTTTPDELAKVFTDYGISTSPNYDQELSIVFKERDTDGKSLIPFIVRSSKRNFGGIRSLWKNKYNYNENSWLDAVTDCIKNNKKMIIVDDNKNSGIDIKTISATIINIASSILNLPAESVKSRIRNNFAFYMMYDMNNTAPKKPHTYHGNKVYTISLKTKVLKDFKDYLESKDTESSSKETEKIYSPSSYIVTERNRLMTRVFSMATNQFYIFMKTRRQTAAKDNFRNAWETLIVLPEFKTFTKNKLADVFIKMAKQKNWFKTNGLISAEEITNIIKSK